MGVLAHAGEDGQDKDGDDDYHVYSVDLDKDDIKDLTPGKDLRAMIEGTSIRLRAGQERDLPRLQVLRNDVAVQAQLLARAARRKRE